MMTHSHCDLCSVDAEVSPYEVADAPQSAAETTASLCKTCREQIEDLETLNATHWHCLHESIWSENPAVKVLAWRVLTALSSERWAQDLLEQLYLDEDLLAWAQAGIVDGSAGESASQTKDSNGTVLAQGDSVILIKDLDVKGANFTAKRGTLVKKIVLTDDPGLVEGRINGSQIVLKACFLKKSS